MVDDLVVHCATPERMRVRDQSGIRCVGFASVEQRFKAARGTAQVFHCLDLRAKGKGIHHRRSVAGRSLDQNCVSVRRVGYAEHAWPSIPLS